MTFLPQAFAHGFQSLCDETEVFYHMSRPYVPEAACGVHFDDPAIGIRWPIRKGLVVSPRDRALPRIAPDRKGQAGAPVPELSPC